MTSEAKRKVLAAASALALYASCGGAETAAAQHTPFSDGPKHNVPRSQDTPESFVVPPRPTRTRASRNRPPRTPQSSAGPCSLDVIRQRESGGNYGAVSPSGRYRGAYQFDRQTWQSVGGSGDPAAASPEEQDARAAELMRRRGTQPWSVCR